MLECITEAERGAAKEGAAGQTTSLEFIPDSDWMTLIMIPSYIYL
jgi:hypothetical protein